MKTELQKILNLKTYFRIKSLTDTATKYTLENPSRILIKNIHSNWLRSMYLKTHKHFPVYVNPTITENHKTVPFGFLTHSVPSYDEHRILEHKLDDYKPMERLNLKFNLIVPEQDVMQYFIQWQRYRKYWWSSITTTPSLFGVGDIKYGEDTADVNIVANFPWGQPAVETVSISSREKIKKGTSLLSCTTSLEGALFIVLLDGFTNATKEGYLRLHRKMAPFKISFGLSSEDPKYKENLQDLATLMHHRLAAKGISTTLPDFTLALDSQINGNLQMGVPYTAILSEDTLANGIFHLLGSSTMLKEQVHVADFDSYVALLCIN